MTILTSKGLVMSIYPLWPCVVQQKGRPSSLSLWLWHQGIDQVGVLTEMRSIQAIWIAPSLPTSPIWNATGTVIASLPPMPNTTNTSSVHGCHLPVLDPWNPDILQFVSSRPRLVGLFALLDTLTSLAEGTHGPRLANTTFIWIINLSNRYMTKQSARSALRSRSPLSSSTLTHSLSMKLPSKSLVSLIVRCKVFSSTIEPRASF